MNHHQKNPSIVAGKAEWSTLLTYVLSLHEGGLHAPLMEIPYRWEEIAPNKESELSSIFGHWDTIHIACDALSLDPYNGIHQILNNLALQQPNGLIPGYVGIINNRLSWSPKTSYPPLWPFVVEEYLELTQDREMLGKCYPILAKQIEWFEKNRHASEGGFYYLDCLDRFWESGVEDGIRYEFGNDNPEEISCVDATSHVFGLYRHASKWSKLLNKNPYEWEQKAEKLKAFIQTEMFDEETGFFHDQWMISHPQRKLAFEGMWPFVVGAATPEQAQRVINENLMEPNRFFTSHPIPTIGIEDPHYGYFFWRGPTRNSMTYWAAKGCLRYSRPDAARILLEKALDATNLQFQRTGTIWEFYHPEGGDPRELSRKEDSSAKGPFSNYLGHNPLIAMAKLWESIKPT